MLEEVRQNDTATQSNGERNSPCTCGKCSHLATACSVDEGCVACKQIHFPFVLSLMMKMNIGALLCGQKPGVGCCEKHEFRVKAAFQDQ